MKAQKNIEDGESGLEAVEKLGCFGIERVSKSGGGCGRPNRQATNVSKHERSTCLKFESVPGALRCVFHEKVSKVTNAVYTLRRLMTLTGYVFTKLLRSSSSQLASMQIISKS